MHLRGFALSIALATAFAGCSDRLLEDDRAVSSEPPKVVITKPERGTMVPDRQIEVEGRVQRTDSDVAKLTINGEEILLDADGSFRKLLPVGDGITLIRTVATDIDGQEGTDSRAIMTGNLVTPETPVFDAIAGRMGLETFVNINRTLQNLLDDDEEISKFAAGMNPIADMGSECFGVVVNITNVGLAESDIEILPTDGGITFDATLNGVGILLEASFAVACVKGSATINAQATEVSLSGRINVGTDRGQMYVDLEEIDSVFDNVQLDVGILDSAIIETFLWDLEGLFGRTVESIIQNKVDDVVSAFIDDLHQGDWVVEIAGAELAFTATPTIVEFDDQGGFLSVDTKVVALNARDNVGYVATPSDGPVMEMRDYSGFRAMVADDVFNQAMSAFWSTGMLENAVAFDSQVEDKQSFLGQAIDRIEVTMTLPPYVDARDERAMSITIGDVIVQIIDESPSGERVVASLALSGTVDIAVEIDEQNRVSMKTGAPSLWVDLLDEHDGVTGGNPFDRDELEVLVSFIAGRLAGTLDGLVGEIPIPSLAGTEIEEAQLSPDRGYVVLGGALSIPE